MQPPSAKRMTTWPPRLPFRRQLPAGERAGRSRPGRGEAALPRARRTHRAAPWRRHGPRAARTDDVKQEQHDGAARWLPGVGVRCGDDVIDYHNVTGRVGLRWRSHGLHKNEFPLGIQLLPKVPENSQAGCAKFVVFISIDK